MITLNSYKDVNDFAGMVGADNLLHYYDQLSSNHKHKVLIEKAINRANQSTFFLNSFNDGDMTYDEYVILSDDILKSRYVHTMGTDVTLGEAQEKGNKGYTVKILEVIKLESTIKDSLPNLVGLVVE